MKNKEKYASKEKAKDIIKKKIKKSENKKREGFCIMHLQDV